MGILLTQKELYIVQHVLNWKKYVYNEGDIATWAMGGIDGAPIKQWYLQIGL